MKIKPVKFPADELKHDCAVEWWYFNGNLLDSSKNRYAFMSCFFRIDSKKARIPFLKHFPSGIICFSHSLVSDINRKIFSPRCDCPVSVSDDSFSKKLLFVNYRPISIRNSGFKRVIEEKSKFSYCIETEDFNLKMVSMKKPMLENGSGYVDLKSKGTYYYSLTNLKTEGTIKIKGEDIKVKGKSWLDHQWADVRFSKKDKWTWFSIQLDNDVEIVCFEFSDGKEITRLATISYQNNRQESAADVILDPSGVFWESPVTKAKYPLSWEIRIPSRKIELHAKPLVKNQEMLFGTMNYWEGPLEVKGNVGRKKVKGSGFLELFGYPKRASIMSIYKKKYLNNFSN